MEFYDDMRKLDGDGMRIQSRHRGRSWRHLGVLYKTGTRLDHVALHCTLLRLRRYPKIQIEQEVYGYNMRLRL